MIKSLSFSNSQHSYIVNIDDNFYDLLNSSQFDNFIEFLFSKKDENTIIESILNILHLMDQPIEQNDDNCKIVHIYKTDDIEQENNIYDKNSTYKKIYNVITKSCKSIYNKILSICVYKLIMYYLFVMFFLIIIDIYFVIIGTKINIT